MGARRGILATAQTFKEADRWENWEVGCLFNSNYIAEVAKINDLTTFEQCCAGTSCETQNSQSLIGQNTR